MIATLTEKMKEAAKVLDFELAAALRDKIINLTSSFSEKKK
jgi:excinuclease UvrABC helicase subunit UvrB